MENKELFLHAGGERYEYIPCLNDDAEHMAVLADIVERHTAFYGTLPAEMKSSMQVDLERGRPLELPWLSGAVVRLGVELGIPTPVHRVIALALAPYVDGRPAQAD